MVIKIMAGILLYALVAYAMVKIEICYDQKRKKLAKSRKAIPFAEVKQRLRVRDRKWD